MKARSGTLSSFITLCIILYGMRSHAQDAGNLPDGWKVLKE